MPPKPIGAAEMGGAVSLPRLRPGGDGGGGGSAGPRPTSAKSRGSSGGGGGSAAPTPRSILKADGDGGSSSARNRPTSATVRFSRPPNAVTETALPAIRGLAAALAPGVGRLRAAATAGLGAARNLVTGIRPGSAGKRKPQTLHELLLFHHFGIEEAITLKARHEREGTWRWKKSARRAAADRAREMDAKAVRSVNWLRPRGPAVCTAVSDEGGRVYWCNNDAITPPGTDRRLTVCGYHVTACLYTHTSGDVEIDIPNALGACLVHFQAVTGGRPKLFATTSATPGAVCVSRTKRVHPLRPLSALSRLSDGTNSARSAASGEIVTTPRVGKLTQRVALALARAARVAEDHPIRAAAARGRHRLRMATAPFLRRRCAKRIQRAYRQYAARRNLRAVKASRGVLVRIEAALTIQRLVRGHVHRVWATRIRKRKMGAAGTLRTVCRRWIRGKLLQKFLRDAHAASVIRSWWKGVRTRANIHSLRLRLVARKNAAGRMHAAECLRALFTGYVVRLRCVRACAPSAAAAAAALGAGGRDPSVLRHLCAVAAAWRRIRMENSRVEALHRVRRMFAYL